MTGISLRRSPLRATASVLATVLVCSCALAPGADSSLSAVKGRIEGVYSLEEWHLGAEAVRAPRVDGRFMLKDGAVITILHNRVQETSQMTVASYGSYLLDATRFSYRYDDTSVFVQTGAGITVSRKLPWGTLAAQFMHAHRGRDLLQPLFERGHQFDQPFNPFFRCSGPTYCRLGQ